MSTRCCVAIRRFGGSVESIYCHSDGYPSGVGRMLEAHYNTKDKVEELIGLGDLSCIKEHVAPKDGMKHGSLGEKIPDVTFAYHRDEGDEWVCVKPQVFPNLKSAFDEFASSMMCFFYLFDIDGKWHECYREGARRDGGLKIKLRSIDEAVEADEGSAE